MQQQDIMSNQDPQAIRQPGEFRDYLTIARFDHSTKHIFILPGMMLAYLLRGLGSGQLLLHIVLGLATAICIASANYCINEWLDSEFDRHHPTKSLRKAVQRDLKGRLVFLEWLIFIGVGLSCAYASSLTMLLVAVVFGLQGVFYNVRPLRTKDQPYLDVISESINNPLRLMIGWAIVDPGTLPPSSVILAYWFGGAFLMAAKRFSEYREIVASHGKELLVRYRASFRGYSEVSLNVSCFAYGLLSSFFLAVFLIKYRIEYILLMPFVTALFAQYLAVSMQVGSSAQAPEKLFKERGLIFTIVLAAIVFAIATFVDIPMFTTLSEQRYISLH
jgi:4-hydroxybenzoate polyprenyltransferase